ncbi:MAG TPA: hypothetical protein VF607_02820 [Verrucomicrobiae bacterium]
MKRKILILMVSGIAMAAIAGCWHKSASDKAAAQAPAETQPSSPVMVVSNAAPVPANPPVTNPPAAN